MKKVIVLVPLTLIALFAIVNVFSVAENLHNAPQTKDITMNQIQNEERDAMQITDPELVHLMDSFTYNDAYQAGALDLPTRELIACVCLTAQQALPELKAHVAAALKAGVTPIEVREAVYQCAPFIGFPKTVEAVKAINVVFTQNGISLPLEPQATVSPAQRYKEGLSVQYPLYGNEIREAMKDLPAGLDADIPRFLTEMCFGDFYTRKGLDVPKRELLMLCVLTTLGAEKQIHAHTLGNLRAGNSRETLCSAIASCLPWIGFPRTLNAINIVKSAQLPGLPEKTPASHTQEMEK